MSSTGWTFPPGTISGIIAGRYQTVVKFHATDYFFNHLKERFELKEMVHLHPGEFGDWPITQQEPLFKLLGGTESSIGSS
jgi:hypothetical protein